MVKEIRYSEGERANVRCYGHGVVAHAQEAHHLHVGGDGGTAGELRVAVHPAHGVGHAVVKEIRYSEGERANVRCYGADDVREGVAVMHLEGVDVSITGNSTNPTRFQHPVAGTYKKECVEQGKKYFSVASGGGTGRTLHPDNMAAGPASYGMTDTMPGDLPPNKKQESHHGASAR